MVGRKRRALRLAGGVSARKAVSIGLPALNPAAWRGAGRHPKIARKTAYLDGRPGFGYRRIIFRMALLYIAPFPFQNGEICAIHARAYFLEAGRSQSRYRGVA
ncbi:MAG TPA: hypothetical protein VJS30_28710 [Paraburkholderia sp.]|nr:hypothetical protein [Paraburkholderia sp.]